MDDNLFKNRLNQLGITKQVDAAVVIHKVEKTLVDLFGDRAKDNLRVVSYNKGLLKIATTSSAWSAECQANISKIKTPPIERVVFFSNTQNQEY